MPVMLWPLLRALPWKWIGLALAIIGLIIGIDHRGYERGFHKRDAGIAAMQAAAAQQEAAMALKAQQAADTYAARTAALQPIIVHSVDKVQTYAQTPAGRVECLSAERVSSILQDRAQLAAATESGAGPVSASPDSAAHPDQR